MKNKILYSLVVLATIIGMSSCKDVTTEGVTDITYYAKFTMSGDKVMLVQVGTPFVDPGVTAKILDEDVTSQIKVTGEVDASTMGLYTLNYSVTNKDGYSSSVSRTVIVCDPTVTADISGTYSVDAANSYRLQLSNSAKIVYSSMFGTYGKGDFSKYTLKITKVAPGFFSVQDFFGGYYTEGRGYAAIYEMQGYVSLDNNYNISLISSKVEGWGDSLDKLQNTSYDPETGILTWSAYYTNTYSFNVVLNKKN